MYAQFYPDDPVTEARRSVNRRCAVALVFALGLCLSALIPMLFHTSASYDGTTGPCITAMSRASGNVNLVHFSNQASVDYNIACTSRVNTMEGVASALIFGGVVLGIIALVYRSRAMRGLQVRIDRHSQRQQQQNREQETEDQRRREREQWQEDWKQNRKRRFFL